MFVLPPSLDRGRVLCGVQVTLATLASRLNDTEEIARVITYSALVAETEAIDSLREVLDGLQTGIRTTLLDIEADLIKSENRQGSRFKDAGVYLNKAARSAVKLTIEGFNQISQRFDSSFEELVEPSRRGLPKPHQLLPWQNWYQAAWNSVTGATGTTGEDDITTTTSHSAPTPSPADIAGTHQIRTSGTIPPPGVAANASVTPSAATTTALAEENIFQGPI
ncbi:unnamed protein product [Discosporangium mesarthrocarpum]